MNMPQIPATSRFLTMSLAAMALALSATGASASAISELMALAGTKELPKVEAKAPAASRNLPADYVERAFNEDAYVRDLLGYCRGPLESKEKVESSKKEDLHVPALIGVSGFRYATHEYWNIKTAGCACSVGIPLPAAAHSLSVKCQDRSAWEFENAQKQAKMAAETRLIAEGMRAKYPNEKIESITASREVDPHGGTCSLASGCSTVYRDVWYVRTDSGMYRAHFRTSSPSLRTLELVGAR